MKRAVWMIVLLFILIGAGCSNQKDNDKTDVNDNISDNQENENSETNNHMDNNNDNQNDDENANTNDDQGTGQSAEETTPTYELDEETSAIEPINDSADEDVVLVTIDDAPDDHSVEMAHTLKDLDVNAIFFVNGHFLESDEGKEKLKEIHDMGFLIGNHTYSHAYLPDLSPEEQRDEIIKVNDMIEDVIDVRPDFFRAPNGANTDTSKEIAEEEDMLLMNWTYGYDFMEPYQDKEKLTEAMISGEGPDVGEENSLLRPGANLLMHDREWTNDALKDIIEGLRDKGYEMVDPQLIDTVNDD